MPARLTDAEYSDLKTNLEYDSQEDGYAGSRGRQMLRALAELEALREFRRRVAYQHSHEGDLKALAEAIGDLLAEYDRG